MGQCSYKYDSLGNLREKILEDRRVVIANNSDTQVRRVRDDANGAVWRYFDHDQFGNVTNKDSARTGGLGIGYQGAYELPITMDGPVTADYAYDGNNRRAYQNIDGEETFTFYSQSGAILMRAKIDPNIRQDASLDINNPTDFTDYIRAGGKTIARIRQRDGEAQAEISYMHQDHLGSPIVASNADGNVLWRESYTPFGEKWLSDGDNDDNVGFTGHIQDHKSGLTYMQARFYDPAIGRFLANDPVTFGGTGDPRFFNRYAYTFNDPINLVDPDGNGPIICALCGAQKHFSVILGHEVTTTRRINDEILATPEFRSGDGLSNALRHATGAQRLSDELITGSVGAFAITTTKEVFDVIRIGLNEIGLSDYQGTSIGCKSGF